jgi:hypothetical protein
MTDFVRLILMLALAGSAVTLAGSAAAWWLDEERRLYRIMRKVLGGQPDAAIVARGRNAAAAFRLDAERILVMWRGGSKALLYPLSALEGAELIVDDRVMARAFKGETRRALDHIENTAGKVTLRLIFDNPRDPDFDLDLWLAEDQLRRNSGSPGQAIQEARSWIARAEAILRRPPALQPLTPPPVVARDERDAEPDEDDEAELPF